MSDNTLDTLNDVEFLDLIIRQFATRPSLQLIVGVVADGDGNNLRLLSTLPDQPSPHQLREIASKLESDGIGWTRLVKKPS